MKFNEFMKGCREKASLTQDEAAKAIGVGISTIQNWERSTTYPERVAISDIAEAYSISVKSIYDALAADHELSSGYVTSNEPKVIPFTDLLPDTLDYSSILGMEFSEKEQDMFLLFALNIQFGGNPVPEILNKYPNSLDLALFIDKLEKYNLFTIKKESLCESSSYGSKYVKGSISTCFTTLTDQGEYIYNLIKSQKYHLFSIYNLDFNDFLSILERYNIISDKKFLIDTIKLLLESDVHYLEEFRENPNKSYTYDKRSRYYNAEPAEIKVSLPIYNKIKQIDSSYYIIDKEEPMDDVYQTEKEIYLKKLALFERNKELDRTLLAPEQFQFKEVKKATASEKAKRFIAEIA